jgi:tetratricopeptide (TPR) repeat protein
MRAVFLLPLLLLAGSPALARISSSGVPSSPMHGYVLGRAAYSADALGEAASFFESANAQDPGKPALVRRAFELAVAAGDQRNAFALARQLPLTDAGAGSEVAFINMVEAVSRKDWKAAEAARARISGAGYVQVVGPISEAWLMFARGQTDAALGLLEPSRYSGFVRSYMAEQRAHMLAAAGRWPEAALAYAGLRASTAAGISFIRQGEADAVFMTGDKARALALLDGGDMPTAAARARLQSGKRIGPLAATPADGMAWMAARLATDLARERPVPLALLFARTATFLSPDQSAAWLICGDVLARSGQRAAALKAYGAVGKGDPLLGVASARRAEVLEAMGEQESAGKLLKSLAEAPGAGIDGWVRLGDWHRRADRFRDAADAYARGMEIESAGDDGPGWALLFLRGSMMERAGDWPAAEADLRAALARAPDEPVVLNYLGYSLLDRGLKLDEANQLIERAAALRPADGGIVDSLGWSQYRQGRYADAVITLERAAELEPTDPTVNEHLGDAYWQVGRRIEAFFRWRAALELEPTPKQRTELRAKLDYGLDAALAMALLPQY